MREGEGGDIGVSLLRASPPTYSCKLQVCRATRELNTALIRIHLLLILA